MRCVVAGAVTRVLPFVSELTIVSEIGNVPEAYSKRGRSGGEDFGHDGGRLGIVRSNGCFRGGVRFR